MTTHYSLREKLLRVLWAGVEVVFFRYSPRLVYAWRNGILRMFGAMIGANVKIYPSARIMYPWLLEIGENSVLSWEVKVYNLGKIKIGSNTVISQYTHLCGGTHDYEIKHFPLIRKGLTIGDHVWIAADAFIGPGVSIGDYGVVGARSVVTKDVAAKVVVAGNPARIIKQRELK